MDDTDSDTLHDFSAERKTLLILGGFEISRKRTIYFILNIIYFLFLFLLYIYLLTMAVVTMFLLPVDREVKVQAFCSFCYITGAVYLPLARLLCTSSLTKTVKLIRQGIFHYSVRTPDNKEAEIKKERVQQIRFLTSLCAKLCYSSAFCNVFSTVLIQVLTVREDAYDNLINPYLPLPLYMPFNTRTAVGYGLGFMSCAIYTGVLYTSSICFMQTLVSCVLQLLANIEVLTYSLSNIEKRARVKLAGNRPDASSKSMEELYQNEEFQKCLYYCLRENILHHHAILRFKKAVSPYVEAMNALLIGFSSVVMATQVVIFLENPGIKFALMIAFISQVIYFFLICYLGQLIANKSEEILNVVYSTPWVETNENFKTLLKIFLTNVEKPIIMRSSGYRTPASLETFGNMVSMGYKIINVLRANM